MYAFTKKYLIVQGVIYTIWVHYQHGFHENFQILYIHPGTRGNKIYPGVMDLENPKYNIVNTEEEAILCMLLQKNS